MANKETQSLMIEAIENYIKCLSSEGTTISIDNMRKIVKLDDIKQSLNKAVSEQKDI